MKRREGRKAVGELLKGLRDGAVAAGVTSAIPAMPATMPGLLGGGGGDGAVGDVNDSVAEGDEGGEDEEGLEKALREYDGKVYGAWLAMREDVERELRGMGIPGFVVRRGLMGGAEEEVLKGRVAKLLDDLCGGE